MFSIQGRFKEIISIFICLLYRAFLKKQLVYFLSVSYMQGHFEDTVGLFTVSVSFMQGRLAEFGPPGLLLSANGIFAAMAQAAGISEEHAH